MNKILVETTKSICKATFSTLTTSASLAYKGGKMVSGYVWDHREEIRSGVTGLAQGTMSLGQSLYGAMLTKESFNKQLETIKAQSQEFDQLSKVKSLLSHNKRVMLDSISVGYSTFLGIQTVDIPPEVEQAYKLAYPELSQVKDLSEVIKTYDPNSLQGIVSGVKGKLFEIRYLDYLNNGHLPEGYTAELAASATNAKWDIAIKGADDAVVNELQLKATNSLDYVEEAMKRYPDVDIVTTDEVYSSLVMHGMVDHVVNSGISNAELSDLVEQSLTDAPLEVHWGPPLLPLLIICCSVCADKALNKNEKIKEAGQRYVKSYAAYMAGGSLAALTGLWGIGVAASIGTSLLLSSGRVKFQRYRSLQEVINNNKKVLKRMRRYLKQGEPLNC